MSDEIEKDAGFSVEKEETASPYDIGGPNVRNVTILTDEDLYSDKPVTWEGFPLVCKKCGVPAILHFMKRCGECGDIVSVKSQKADQYVKDLQEKYNGK